MGKVLGCQGKSWLFAAMEWLGGGGYLLYVMLFVENVWS